ncbi:Protein PLANT CADMIUM RESISTANCE 7 [Bulinus truncatus]|nr:Protein PLANT CADMIUM RESISTANCE 7 [Bulinus truncatus]
MPKIRTISKTLFTQNARPSDASDINYWDFGLWSCCESLLLTCITLICPCYVFGKIAEATDRSCCLYGLLCLSPATFCVQAVIRRKVREEMDISGTFSGDFMTALFCPFCAIVQEARELREVDRVVVEWTEAHFPKGVLKLATLQRTMKLI